MDNIPYGYCQCGCGKKTKLAKYTDSKRERTKGKPYRYLRGHATRKYADPRQKHDTYRNKPEVKERQKAYYRFNSERIKAQALAWQKANPERRRAHAMLRLRAESEGELSADEVIQMYDDQQGLCAYCETPLFGNYHLDHMLPISRGGTHYWHNVAITCPSCNMSKHAKTAEEFMLCR